MNSKIFWEHVKWGSNRGAAMLSSKRSGYQGCVLHTGAIRTSVGTLCVSTYFKGQMALKIFIGQTYQVQLWNT